jgi:MYXO-CTERM domain-containing protein
MIDSGWVSLLQVSNTDLKNIRWENNTIVQHAGSVNAGIMAVVYTACSSGMCGGSLVENTVFWTNNVWVFDGVRQQAADKNFVQTTNLILTKDPGFINYKGSQPSDYDLVAGSQLIDQGTPVDEVTLDFLNRTVPDSSGKPDIGAFEYNSKQVSTPPVYAGPIEPSHGNLIGKGGATGSGGATTKPGSGGNTTTTSKPGSGGSIVPVTGGAGEATPGTGGKTSGSGGIVGSGGVLGSGGATTPPVGSGGSKVASSGGAGSGGVPGSGGSTGTTTNGGSGCSCRVDQPSSGPGLWAGLLGFALFALRRRKPRH